MCIFDKVRKLIYQAASDGIQLKAIELPPEQYFEAIETAKKISAYQDVPGVSAELVFNSSYGGVKIKLAK